MRKITYSFLILMLLSPILSYFTLTLYGHSIYYYFRMFVTVYGCLFLFVNLPKWNIYFPKFLYFLVGYIVYILIWSNFNGELERRGAFALLFNNLYIQTLLVILVIYNTKYSDRFINFSKVLVKYLLIVGVIASIIQIFNINFLNSWAYYNFSWGEAIYSFRRTSIFGFVGANEIGLSFVPLTSVFLGYLLIKGEWAFIYLVLIGIITILTNARYVMVEYFIIIFQYILCKSKNIFKVLQYTIFSIILFLVIIIVMIKLGYSIDEFVYKRLFPEQSITESTRYKAIETFAIFFPRSPYFGTGVSLTEEIRFYSQTVIGSYQIHVMYLSHLVAYGIVGGFFLFGFWFSVLVFLFINYKKTNFSGSFFAMVIYLWAQLTLVEYSFFFTGLLFALVFDKYFIDKNLLNIN